MKGQRIGYIRVSTIEQNIERQLENIQLDRVFVDKASGKDKNRPQLTAMLDFIREGDVVLVHSMDRIARNLEDLCTIVQSLTSKGIQVTFAKENLTFSGEDKPLSLLFLSIYGRLCRI